MFLRYFLSVTFLVMLAMGSVWRGLMAADTYTYNNDNNRTSKAVAATNTGGTVRGIIAAPPSDSTSTDSIPDSMISASKPVGRTITLSDFGAEDLAYLCVPTTPPTVGIVLVPDVYGLDSFTKAEADRLAAMGYLVLAVNIYNGHTTTDPDDIATTRANMNAESAMKTLDSGFRFFRESPKFKVDHIVAMGWGTGANYVFQAAREDKLLDGAITFYGPVETEAPRVGKFVAPLCALYPEKDPVATHENVLTFENLMKAAGNDFSAWFIAAGSGWSNPSSKTTYNPTEDREAWKVAVPFLIRIAAEPVKDRKPPSIIDKAKDGIKKMFE